MNVEKAGIEDAPQIHRLVNYFAAKGKMLPRPLSEIYENLRDYFVIRNQNGELIACCALHICWADLAEIKALAVKEEEQNKGLGSQLVRSCIQEARSLGISTLFTLTYQSEFFLRFGFKKAKIKSLPRKIWGECQRCPKFPNCDEVAMVLKLK